MAVLAIGSLLEFGKLDGIIPKGCGLETTAPGSSAPSMAGPPSVS
jgi:hypothetical protein